MYLQRTAQELLVEFSKIWPKKKQYWAIQLISKQASFQVLLTLFLSATSLPEAMQK